MFLRIARAQSAEQFGIRGAKRPFDPNIICLNRNHFTSPALLCQERPKVLGIKINATLY